MDSNSNAQPTILVKKADGSSVRMTLAELQKMKNGQQAPSQAHARPPRKHQPSPGRGRPPQMSQAVATTTPVKDIFVDEAKAKQTVQKIQAHSAGSLQSKPWQRIDTRSPLEEQPETKEIKMENTPLGGVTQTVELALKKAGWPVTRETTDRLTPLILSRVKDVRTDAQFLVHAMTPTHRGGVGLSPDQAEKLLAAIQSLLSGVKNIAVGQSPRGQVSGRPMIHDVLPPPSPPGPSSAPASTGPTEEFGRFSLVDFRRLGTTTDASVSRLKEKFDTLKQESYMLFLDAREAWEESPLYRQYIAAISSALQQKNKLSEIVPAQGKKEEMTMDVVKAVVQINTYING